MCELACQIFQKKQEEKRIEEEQAANARYWKIPAYCDDDGDYDFAITPILSTEEPIDSLSMGDEHLDTFLATGSDEVIKSSVEDLVSILIKRGGKGQDQGVRRREDLLCLGLSRLVNNEQKGFILLDNQT
nr:hypothetical protein [Tanacetum cinerariifolium]